MGCCKLVISKQRCEYRTIQINIINNDNLFFSIRKLKIGFIGLGKMGGPMTKNLIKARYKVNVYDTNPSTFQPLVNIGAIRQNSIKDIGKSSDCIFIMVYPAERTSQIIFEKNEC